MGAVLEVCDESGIEQMKMLTVHISTITWQHKFVLVLITIRAADQYLAQYLACRTWLIETQTAHGTGTDVAYRFSNDRFGRKIKSNHKSHSTIALNMSCNCAHQWMTKVIQYTNVFDTHCLLQVLFPT